MIQRLCQIRMEEKKALDALLMDLGRTLADIERTEKAGPDYFPKEQKMPKWGSQDGFVFMGDQKIKLQVPRLRHHETG